MLTSGPEEARLGMGVFATDTEPLGGRLRDRIEDFVVEELPNRPPRVENGDYTAATITARNWETNRLVRALSKNLKLPRKGIFFAGTKDKRAVTTQQFTFACPTAMVEAIQIHDVEVSDIYPTDRPVVIGNLRGNTFHLTVRGVKADPGDITRIMVDASEKLRAMGGFPNFFGVQRFGAVRPMTHLAGRYLLAGQLQRAVWTYLTAAGTEERPADARARARLRKEQDLSAALLYYPPDLLFERTMLGYLARRSDDWHGALRGIPPNLLSMFVHAYQSYIFNQILTRRMRAGIPPGEPVEGDLVIPVDALGFPDHHDAVKVESHNLEKVRRRVSEGRAFVTGMVMGSEVPAAEGPMGEIERSVMEDNDIRPGHFIIPEYPKLSSKGLRRELVAPMRDFTFEVESGTVKVSFTLFKGTYATSLMREFIKSPRLVDY